MSALHTSHPEDHGDRRQPDPVLVLIDRCAQLAVERPWRYAATWRSASARPISGFADARRRRPGAAADRQRNPRPGGGAWSSPRSPPPPSHSPYLLVPSPVEVLLLGRSRCGRPKLEGLKAISGAFTAPPELACPAASCASAAGPQPPDTKPLSSCSSRATSRTVSTTGHGCSQPTTNHRPRSRTRPPTSQRYRDPWRTRRSEWRSRRRRCPELGDATTHHPSQPPARSGLLPDWPARPAAV